MSKRKFCLQWELSCEIPYIYYNKVTFFIIPRQSAFAFGDGRLDALCSVGSEEDKAMGCRLL
jgi:hypothetical protein